MLNLDLNFAPFPMSNDLFKQIHVMMFEIKKEVKIRSIYRSKLVYLNYAFPS